MPFITEVTTERGEQRQLSGGWEGGSELSFVCGMSSEVGRFHGQPVLLLEGSKTLRR